MCRLRRGSYACELLTDLISQAWQKVRRLIVILRNARYPHQTVSCVLQCGSKGEQRSKKNLMHLSLKKNNSQLTLHIMQNNFQDFSGVFVLFFLPTWWLDGWMDRFSHIYLYIFISKVDYFNTVIHLISLHRGRDYSFPYPWHIGGVFTKSRRQMSFLIYSDHWILLRVSGQKAAPWLKNNMQ